MDLLSFAGFFSNLAVIAALLVVFMRSTKVVEWKMGTTVLVVLALIGLAVALFSLVAAAGAAC